MDPSHIQVRVASADDVELLAEFGARTFRDTFAAENTEEDMATYLGSAFSHSRVAAEVAEPTSAFLIAEVQDAPVGYARMHAGAAPQCILGASPVEIVRFYSEYGWIGKGVGPTLMAACLARAADDHHDVVWLDVWERNVRAIAFYSKWGFTIVGEQAFVLGSDVQHDLLMAMRDPGSHASPDALGAGSAR